jgi:hypothetical protein
MLSVAIVAILASVSAQIIIQINRYFILSNARTEIQRDARAIMYSITRELRQAQSNTIVIDRASASQPFYSRITFTTIQGKNRIFQQNGNKLQQITGSNTKTLSDDLRYLAFTFPRSDELSIVSVSFTLSKLIYQGKLKTLHMASEKVEVMN